MINDTERREVARRLREVQSCVIPGTKTEGDPITGRIIGVACWYDLPDFQGLLGRLADLIEPSGSGQNRDTNRDTVPKESPAVQKAPECDRDALLKLADEMERMQRDAATAATDGVVDAWCLREYARRIREALGVTDG